MLTSYVNSYIAPRECLDRGVWDVPRLVDHCREPHVHATNSLGPFDSSVNGSAELLEICEIIDEANRLDLSALVPRADDK